MMTANVAQAKQSEWVQAHEALSRLAKQRAAADAEEGRCLLRALRSAAHLHLGFGSFGEYVERLFGYKPRSTQEKLRVAEALEGLPALAAALEGGVLAWSAVRELTRVARPENEREWLDLALGKTLRQVEQLVEGKSPGDAPSAAPSPAERRHVLRFEVAAETFALFREAIVQLRRRTDSMLDDDSALLLMARHVLGGPVDPGRASYQIALTVCAHCGAGHQHAAGEPVVVGAEVIERARCDGQHVGRVDVTAGNENAGGSSVAGVGSVAGIATVASNDNSEGRADAHLGGVGVGSDEGAVSVERDIDALSVAGQVEAVSVDREIEAVSVGAHVGGADVGGVSVRSDVGAISVGAHVGPEDHRSDGAAHLGGAAHSRAAAAHPRAATHGANARAPARAKQTIPPAVRRAVLRRDNERCQAPGCRNATFLDLHHIDLRSEGGPNAADNLVTLCTAHHRAAHCGELVVSGRATRLQFRHADGSEYGQPARPSAIDAQTKVFSALRHLGFREGEVRMVMAELGNESALGDASTERLLREALRRMGPWRGRG